MKKLARAAGAVLIVHSAHFCFPCRRLSVPILVIGCLGLIILMAHLGALAFIAGFLRRRRR